MATKSNIVIDQGSTLSLTVQVTTVAGDVFNLTNYTAACKLSKHWSSSNTYTLTATVTDATDGEITLAANNTTTSNIPAGRYMYDIEVTSNTGTVTRVLQGIMTVTPEITK
jgi:hypothetical protein